MRLGLALPHYDTSLAGQPLSWEGLVSVAERAERAGFDSLWVSDHFFLDWGKYGGPDTVQGAFECWTTMSALAAVTKQIRIGSMVLCNDFRNPALLAKMAATLDVLSEGRLELGIGAGWYEAEYRAAGIEFDRPRVRIDRMRESCEVIARLLEGEEVTYKGDHVFCNGAICRPQPVQDPRPAIWIGGKGDRTLDAVAAVADGWNFSWIGSFESYEERSAAADRACEAVGRAPESLRRSVGAYVLAGVDGTDVRRRFDRLVHRTPPGVLQPINGGAGVSWDEFRSQRVAGTVDEVVDRLSRLAELGVEEVVVALGALPFQLSDEEDIDLVGEAIGGALHELNGGKR